MSRTLKQFLFSIFTVGVYSVLWGWKIALLISIAIGWHECSHLLAAKYLKLKTGGFTLIPFVGGVALIMERYKARWQQSFVAIMGPVGGGFLALLTTLAWYITGWQVLAPAAFYMSLLNLLNLLPLAMLDGGQLMDTITYSINRTFGMVAHVVSTAIAIVAITWKINMTIGILIAIFGIPQIIVEIGNWREFHKGNFQACTQEYLSPPTKMNWKQMLLVAGAWIGTMIILILNESFLVN